MEASEDMEVLRAATGAVNQLAAEASLKKT
jgi:hypothetical protein